MKRPKRVCSVLVIFVIIGVTSTVAISTGKKDTKTENEVEKTEQEMLPTPMPSPSPSTSETSLTSRRGTTSKKEVVDGFKPSTKFTSRNKNSSAAASSKSSQTTYPDNELTIKSPEEGKEDEPQPVVLELLDGKEDSQVTDSPDTLKYNDAEGRGKYPRIYYGEAYGSADEEEGPTKKEHHDSNLEGQNHNQKYFYPKSYVHNKRGHKRSKNKKKFEYKHEEDVRQLEEPYPHGHPGGVGENEHEHSTQQTPELQYQGQGEHYSGKENVDEEENNGGGPDNYGYGHHREEPSHYSRYHRHEMAADIISKALHVLIPSALVLTGLSAIFPNRIHVRTNDYYNGVNTNNVHRQKRSIDYTGQTNEMLQPEHRSMDEEAYPSYKSYNFEIGSPRGKYLDQSQQLYYKEFVQMPTSSDERPFYRVIKNVGHGQNAGFLSNELSLNRAPQNPEEFDLYHHGPRNEMTYDFAGSDSHFAPSSIATPTLAAVPENLNSFDHSPPTKRKIRTRTKIKIRPGIKRKSRPLPTDPPSIPDVNEFQSHLIGSEKSLKVRQILNRSSTLQDKMSRQHSELLPHFRLGDEYLKSIVEEKASPKQVDLSPDGAVMGLITSYAEHDKDSPICQKKALCELAMKGKTPTATKFETFLWSLASLVPEQFSKLYELDDIFKAVQGGSCHVFQCASPNLDIQV